MEALFKEIINQTIKPIMKGASFKKKALNFYKEEKGLFFLINIQKSHGNSSSAVGFYVNCCIHSKSIDVELGKEQHAFPKEYQCHFRQRIEHLSPNTPDKFSVTSTTNLDRLNHQLKQAFQTVLDFFQKINDDKTFVELLATYGTLQQYEIFQFCLKKGYNDAANNLVGLCKQDMDTERWETFFKEAFIKILDKENSTIKIANLL